VVTNADELSRRFRNFAGECRGSSPIYERLSGFVADDAEMLTIVAAAAGSRFNPNLFFASARYLCLSEGKEVPASPEEFRSFCTERADALKQLVASRVTQTNEVMRSSYLLLGFEVIWNETQRPLALIEVGTSAGLNLLFDRYRHDYGEHGAVGPIGSKVVLTPQVISGSPPIPSQFPPVRERLGIDIRPLNAADSDDRRWLRSCVWPEHRDRERRLENALDVAAHEPPHVLAGNVVDVLHDVVGRAEPDTVLVVFHTNTIGYLSADERERLAAQLREFGGCRSAYRLTGEGPSPGDGFEATLTLTDLTHESEGRVLANLVQHGRAFEWVARSAVG
jgi:hypothetical protein